MIYKKGRYDMVKFHWKGKVIRKSTRATTKKDANSIAGPRSELALGNFGILEEKKICPTLADFSRKSLSHSQRADRRFPKNRGLLSARCRQIGTLAHGKSLLDEITNQEAMAFAALQQKALSEHHQSGIAHFASLPEAGRGTGEAQAGTQGHAG